MSERLARLLVLMGSGETSPTMVKTHRAVFERFGPPPVPAVLLDTPFGFQENAPEIADKALTYFAESVGSPLELAGMRRVEGADPLAVEQTLRRVADARVVFAGPGSPTYALRQWAGTRIPELLADKLRSGGCVTFASAAALTLGIKTVPVYEIYKSGQDPHWLDGLDLLGELGVSAVVIPHYNNAEGGHHDTRFCYLGETRLARMEAELPDDAFVLGVDEHTGCVLDLDAGTATVVGLGLMTLRRGGRSHEVPSGEVLAIEDLSRLAGGSTSRSQASPTAPSPAAGSAGEGPGTARSPLVAAVDRLDAEFTSAMAARDLEGAVRSLLALEDEIHAWGADTLQSDEMDRARACLRQMIVRLGELAEVGAVDRRDVVGPFVESLLALRSAARDDRRWNDADAVRDHLVALGVEVRDATEGTEWGLLS